MEATNAHNQGYWFVLREDQGNVILSSNNLATIQNPHIPTEQPARYIINTNSRHYQPEVPTPREHVEDITQEESQQKTKNEFWDKNKVRLLLNLSLENKNLDKEIGDIIGASPEECSSKYRQLRKTYLRLLKKKRMGKDIKWIHYNICEDVFTDLRALPSSVLDPWEEHRTRRLLSLYIEYLPKFRNPHYLQKDLWKEIAARLDSTGYSCYHKFKNLRRSYLNWLNRNGETGLKWQYQEYFDRIYYNFNPNTRSWDRHKIKKLLEAYAEIAYKFKNPRLQKKELWNEISRKVGENPTACDKKFRNLKQTYMRLKMKANAGRLTTKWRYFRDFETIYSPNYISSSQDGSQTISSLTHEENYIKFLLEFYLDNKEKFKDPLTRNRSLWRIIAGKLGMTPDECDKKFRNLKQTYIRLAWKKKQTGVCSKWPYFSYFDKIYDETNAVRLDNVESEVRRRELNEAVRSEVRRAMEDLHCRRDADLRFERLARLAQESNDIQRERNRILQALLDRK